MAYPLCPKGASAWNFHCSVQFNFKCLKAKGLAPLGRLLQNPTNHLCLLHDCPFLCDSSFNFLCFLLILSTAPRHISSKQQFLLPENIFLPSPVFSQEKSYLKNICGSYYFVHLCRICVCLREGSMVLLDLTRLCEMGTTAAVLQEQYKLAEVLIKQEFGAFPSQVLIISDANFGKLLTRSC